jgi:hypothetical protein
MPCYFRCSLLWAALLLGLPWSAAAQETPVLRPDQAHNSAAPAAGAPSDHVDEDFIHKQFGSEFSLVSFSTPFVRDLDGDGIDDLVIAARSKKPMLDAGEHSYQVIDPYYAFYGYGDPKMTINFGSEDLQTRNLVILVIHGSGEDAWRAETPKAKFVIINLPFKEISVRRLQLHKKQVNAIYAEEEESTAADSVIFWDGKQYKYQPLGLGGSDD